jgi:CHAD domain
MRARRVKRLDPAGTLADNAERIIRVRLDEVYGFVPQALQPSEVASLHNMRIAAKRLRYVLEVTAFCFGPYAATAVKRARDLQDLIGEIHDCDVMIPRVLAHVDELRARDAAMLRLLAAGESDLDPVLTRGVPNRAAYRGLEVLAVHLQARRDLLFEQFLALWGRLERRGFRARLEAALTERPDAPEGRPENDGDEPEAPAADATMDPPRAPPPIELPGSA